MNFKANGKEYKLIDGLRNTLKPGWGEMLNPAKARVVSIDPYCNLPLLAASETALANIGETLVGKNILEVGCANGERCYLMAKYEGTKVHGIDVDEYTVDQSPDVNTWNPDDIKFIHNKIDGVRKQISEKFPVNIRDKVTFSTVSMEDFTPPNKYDVIVSFDVLEHILDLDTAFRRMADSIKSGGIMAHEHNPFFSLTGGHSLCTLDFHFGHCILNKKDFRSYISKFRPIEEKIAMNFYNKCLNRATLKDVRGYAKKHGFEIVAEKKHASFIDEVNAREKLTKNVLPDVIKQYPSVTMDDLLHDAVHMVMRKV